MEVIFLLILPATLWAQSWHFLGQFSNPKAMGTIATATAAALGGMVIFGDGHGALDALVLVWAIYAAGIAAQGLAGHDEKTHGFFALFATVVSVIYVVFYMQGQVLADGNAGAVSNNMGIAVALLAVIAAMNFFTHGAGFSKMRNATGWVQLVAASGVAIMGGLTVIGL